MQAKIITPDGKSEESGPSIADIVQAAFDCGIHVRNLEVEDRAKGRSVIIGEDLFRLAKRIVELQAGDYPRREEGTERFYDSSGQSWHDFKKFEAKERLRLQEEESGK